LENRALIASHAQITLLEIALGLPLGRCWRADRAQPGDLALARMVLARFWSSPSAAGLCPGAILTLWFGFGIESKMRHDGAARSIFPSPLRSMTA
jgi:hypothetical protein